MSKYTVIALRLSLFLLVSALDSPLASAAPITNYPILQAVQNSGQALYGDTLTWMNRWNGLDLEQTETYTFSKISGSTSVNFKVARAESRSTKHHAGLGSFVPTNSSGNPTTELAYFNLSAILGWDSIFRPAVRYELGEKADQEFLQLMKSSILKPSQQKNEQNLIRLISSGDLLQGCIKAEKDESWAAIDSMADMQGGSNGQPNFKSSVIASLQLQNPAPLAGQMIDLQPGYTGDAYELAQEYSVVMIFDVTFQQGDRYSGGNLTARKIDGKAHFYSTDNGGAYIRQDATEATQQLQWMSRFDYKTIDGLRKLNLFLQNPSVGYLGYYDANTFVVDLGLYFELSPSQFVTLLQRNIQLVLNRVDSLVSQYGDSVYLK